MQLQHIDVTPARAFTEFVNPHASLTAFEASGPQAITEFASVAEIPVPQVMVEAKNVETFCPSNFRADC